MQSVADALVGQKKIAQQFNMTQREHAAIKTVVLLLAVHLNNLVVSWEAFRGVHERFSMLFVCASGRIEAEEGLLVSAEDQQRPMASRRLRNSSGAIDYWDILHGHFGAVVDRKKISSFSSAFNDPRHSPASSGLSFIRWTIELVMIKNSLDVGKLRGPKNPTRSRSHRRQTAIDLQFFLLENQLRNKL